MPVTAFLNQNRVLNDVTNKSGSQALTIQRKVSQVALEQYKHPKVDILAGKEKKTFNSFSLMVLKLQNLFSSDDKTNPLMHGLRSYERAKCRAQVMELLQDNKRFFKALTAVSPPLLREDDDGVGRNGLSAEIV